MKISLAPTQVGQGVDLAKALLALPTGHYVVHIDHAAAAMYFQQVVGDYVYEPGPTGPAIVSLLGAQNMCMCIHHQ
jgi:hypothetical protein